GGLISGEDCRWPSAGPGGGVDGHPKRWWSQWDSHALGRTATAPSPRSSGRRGRCGFARARRDYASSESVEDSTNTMPASRRSLTDTFSLDRAGRDTPCLLKDGHVLDQGPGRRCSDGALT